MPRTVLVLGPHRSGTSATTRVLSLLGARLPPRLLVPTIDNPVGYWEAQDLVDGHDQLLEDLGRSWEDPRPLPDGWLLTPAARSAAIAFGALLDGWLSDEAPLVLKDPRLCRLAPLWLDLLDQRHVEVAVVLATRPPGAVAASLAVRDGLPVDLGGWLWLVHLLDAERATRGRPRRVVAYDELLADPISQLGVLAEVAGLPPADAAARAAITAFLDPHLRHHAGDGGSDGEERRFGPALTELLASGERALHAEGGPDVVALDAVTDAVDAQPLAVDAFLSAHEAVVAARAASAEAADALDRHEAAASEAAALLRQQRDEARAEVLALQAALEAQEAGAELAAEDTGRQLHEVAAELDRLQRSRSIRIARRVRRLGRRSAGDGPPGPDVAFVLVVERGPLEWQSVLLVDSLRRWGGPLASAPVYAASPRPDRLPRPAIRAELTRLGVQFVDGVVNPDTSGYGTVNRVVAAAHIERTTGQEILVVIDSDTLVLGPLPALVLAPGVDLAARAVDLLGICTTGPGDPMHRYWEQLGALAGVDLGALPRGTATVDGASIVANYNGGLVAVRRSVGILAGTERLWFDSMAAGVRPSREAPAFRAGSGPVPAEVAEIFGSAQAALAVAAAARTDGIVALPPTYNVPLHLLEELPDPVREAWFPAAVHVHYHWLLDAETDPALDPLRHGPDSPLSAEQRAWLDRRLRWRDGLSP